MQTTSCFARACAVVEEVVSVLDFKEQQMALMAQAKKKQEKKKAQQQQKKMLKKKKALESRAAEELLKKTKSEVGSVAVAPSTGAATASQVMAVGAGAGSDVTLCSFVTIAVVAITA